MLPDCEQNTVVLRIGIDYRNQIVPVNSLQYQIVPVKQTIVSNDTYEQSIVSNSTCEQTIVSNGTTNRNRLQYQMISMNSLQYQIVSVKQTTLSNSTCEQTTISNSTCEQSIVSNSTCKIDYRNQIVPVNRFTILDFLNNPTEYMQNCSIRRSNLQLWNQVYYTWPYKLNNERKLLFIQHLKQRFLKIEIICLFFVNDKRVISIHTHDYHLCDSQLMIDKL